MSIFKESFKKYVRDQIALREAIISQGNKINQGVIQSRNYLTNADPKVIKQLNLPTNKIDYVFADTKWKYYCTQARNAATFPDIDRYESFLNQWVRLVPDINANVDLFENMNTRENFYRG